MIVMKKGRIRRLVVTRPNGQGALEIYAKSREEKNQASSAFPELAVIGLCCQQIVILRMLRFNDLEGLVALEIWPM